MVQITGLKKYASNLKDRMEHSIDCLPIWIFESDLESDDKNNGRMGKGDEKYGAKISWSDAHLSVPKCICNFIFRHKFSLISFLPYRFWKKE